MEVIGSNSDIVAYTALFLHRSLETGGESAPILSDFVSFARAGALELDLEGAGAASLPGPPEGQAGALRRFRKIKNDPGGAVRGPGTVWREEVWQPLEGTGTSRGLGRGVSFAGGSRGRVWS